MVKYEVANCTVVITVKLRAHILLYFLGHVKYGLCRNIKCVCELLLPGSIEHVWEITLKIVGSWPWVNTNEKWAGHPRRQGVIALC